MLVRLNIEETTQIFITLCIWGSIRRKPGVAQQRIQRFCNRVFESMVEFQVEGTRGEMEVVVNKPLSKPDIVLRCPCSITKSSTDVNELFKYWFNTNPHVEPFGLGIEQFPSNHSRAQALNPVTYG